MVKPKNGFTIIEVLIVLAIAGLILVVVLIAIPQLQRNARNLQRKSHAELFFGELLNYLPSNNGKFPGAQHPKDVDINSEIGSADDFSARFVDNNPDFVEPLGGGEYQINWGPSIGGLGHIDWMFGAWCNGDVFDSNLDWNGDRSKIAVIIGLEPGDLEEDSYGVNNYWDARTDSGRPQDATFCIDNSE
jgi:prepilin-type N-terminal cleavage/methylation domain-containing protein